MTTKKSYNKIFYISPLEYSPEEIFHREFFTEPIQRLIAQGIDKLRQTKTQEKNMNGSVETLAATYGSMAELWLGLIRKYAEQYGVLDSFHAILLVLTALSVQHSEKLLTHDIYRVSAQHQLARLNKLLRLEKRLGSSVADIDVDRAVAGELENTEGMGMALAKLNDMLDIPLTKTKFDDIIGVENVIDLLKESVILSSLPPNQLSLDGMKGLIFFGMPGTGKSILVEAFSNESNRKQASLTPSNLTSAYTGVTEKAISMLFKKMREQPSVVFIDEIDLVFVNREQNNTNIPVYVTYLQSQIMQETSRTGVQNNNIYFMAATNYIRNVDPAILSRLQKPIFVPLPSFESRMSFFRKTFAKQNIGFNENDINTLARETQFFSGRDLSMYIAQILSTMLVETLRSNYFTLEEVPPLFVNKLNDNTAAKKNLFIPYLGITPIMISIPDSPINLRSLKSGEVYELTSNQKLDFSLYGIPSFHMTYANKIDYKATTTELKYAKFIADNKEFIEPEMNIELLLNKLITEVKRN